MNIRSIHTVTHEQYRHAWDNSIPPVLTVNENEVVTFQTRDSGNDQIQPGDDVEAVRNLDFSRINPISGPIAIAGARPGDVLQVDILGIETRDWGWTAIIPGFGLLADEYPDPFVHVWAFDRERNRAEFRPGISVPLDPFIGVIGVAPAGPGEHPTLPPRNVGGNMDIRFMREGTSLYLPVAVENAMFSLGDAHAAQGDGEVCGVAIETAATVTVRFSLHRSISLKTPEFDVSGALVRTSAEHGYHATTGIGPDLMEASKDSVRAMIAHLERKRGLAPDEAYALCSVAGDLKISEVVDAPNWVVSFFLPNNLFQA
ncbi:MAG: Formamidase [Chloroflexi bacterium]|nr:Formamidase [Chloroflexota bacterium]